MVFCIFACSFSDIDVPLTTPADLTLCACLGPYGSFLGLLYFGYVLLFFLLAIAIEAGATPNPLPFSLSATYCSLVVGFIQEPIVPRFKPNPFFLVNGVNPFILNAITLCQIRSTLMFLLRQHQLLNPLYNQTGRKQIHHLIM